jgi:predicted methyltransferase
MRIESQRTLASILAFTALLLSGVVSAAGSEIHPAIAEAVAHPDRPEADLAEDPYRKPAEIMEFAGVRPGMILVDMFTGGGWYSELLGRAVGEGGRVYAQNPPAIYERFENFSERVAARFADDRLTNVARWDKPFNGMGLQRGKFDGAMINLVFHDMFWLADDVPAAIEELYGALKPGGWVAVIDHAAPDGSGAEMATDPRGPHRVDESLVKQIFADAGFTLEAESRIFRNPDDDRQASFFAPEGPGKNTDRFVLKFRK